MHTLANPPLRADLGFVTDSYGNLVFALPRFSAMDPDCGLQRDSVGDITPTGSIPTTGFLKDAGDGDLTFRSS